MPKNQHLIPLEVFTVNTFENLNRRIVISTSVLLIAVWLPLSASALGVTKASEDSQNSEMRAHMSHSHGSDDSASGEQIGFAEEDPAGNGFQSDESERNDTFIACHGRGDKSVAHGAPDFSDLADEADQAALAYMN